MRLDDIMGHDRIKRVLAKISADGRVGHAYIFEGMRGVGRMTTAQAFAQLLVCENPTGGTACGEIFTRSRFSSSARRKASAALITPSISPVEAITLISLSRISPFI